MVPPFPLVPVGAIVFDTYRQRMRRHFAIPNDLDTRRCVACREPRTASVPGEREHAKTGVCEACWDVLMSDPADPGRANALGRCTRLRGKQACDYLVTWISLNRVAPGGNLTCVEPLARHITSVATNVQEPPDLWHAGERP